MGVGLVAYGSLRKGVSKLPFQPVPNTVLAELRYLQDNQQIENGLYFDDIGDWDESNMANLASGLLEWYEAELQPFQSNQCTLKEIYITPLELANLPTYSFVPTSVEAGLQIGEPMPLNCTFAVKFNTSSRGRGSTGRNYTVGVYTDAISHNTFQDTYVNGIVSGYNSLMPTLGGYGTFRWVHVRRRVNNVTLPSGFVSVVQAATFTDKTADSQRRRLPGRGA